MKIERCACGKPLHYSTPEFQRTVERVVALLGPVVRVTVVGGPTYEVPRHYIALHGLKAGELPIIAAMFGWKSAS